MAKNVVKKGKTVKRDSKTGRFLPTKETQKGSKSKKSDEKTDGTGPKRK